MTIIFKVGYAVAVLLAMILLMGMRAKHPSVASDLENQTCEVPLGKGPQGTAMAEGVMTYGPASALIQFGDDLRRRWHGTASPAGKNCPWFPQSPRQF